MRVFEETLSGWRSIDIAPLDEDLTLLVTDGQGEPYRFPHPLQAHRGWLGAFGSGNASLVSDAAEMEAVPPHIEAMMGRRFPPPWTVIEHAESYWVQDATGQAVGWFYFRDHPEVARHAGVLTRDEARRMAAKLRPAARAAAARRNRARDVRQWPPGTIEQTGQLGILDANPRSRASRASICLRSPSRDAGRIAPGLFQPDPQHHHCQSASGF